MDVFIFIVGFLGFIGLLVYSIVLLMKKQKDKIKNPLKGVSLSLILMIIGLSIGSSKAISKEEAINEGYGACKVCNP